MRNLFFIFLFFCTHILTAQQNQEAYPKRRQVVYSEFMGTSLQMGVQFDMRLRKGVNDGLGLRAGVGVLSNFWYSLDRGIAFPIGINHITGKKRHGFVIGAGIIPAAMTLSAPYIYVSQNFPPTTNIEPISPHVAKVGIYGEIGYRFSPKPNKDGFMFQIELNPLILVEPMLYFGAGIGYSF